MQVIITINDSYWPEAAESVGINKELPIDIEAYAVGLQAKITSDLQARRRRNLSTEFEIGPDDITVTAS